MTDTARSLRQSERLAKRAAADSAPATEKAGPPVTKKAKTDVKPQKSNVEHLNVGGSLPDGIVLDDQNGQKINVSDIVKTGTVVIFGKCIYTFNVYCDLQVLIGYFIFNCDHYIFDDSIDLLLLWSLLLFFSILLFDMVLAIDFVFHIQ